MRLDRSKDWWLNRARREGCAAIGAGLLAFDPAPEASVRAAAVEETRIAFGKFVNLMRRRRGLRRWSGWPRPLTSMQANCS